MKGQCNSPFSSRSGSIRLSSRGFTLLEVLLSMTIAILILAAITMAVDFNLRVLNSGRSEVEEAQLARAILRRVADDLRSTVRYEKVDVQSMISQASANTSGGGGSGSSGSSGGTSNSGGSSNSGGGSGDTGTGQTIQPLQAQSANSGSSGGSSSGSSNSNSGSNSGSSGSSSSGSGNAETESQTQNLAEEAVVTAQPGLYGNVYELQVDVSRLPRIDQYERMVQTPDGRPSDLVSDVKTVAYYVSTGVGLVRREMDRAATSYLMNNGGIGELGLYEELLAPEVVALEFRYFDGVEWLDEWDSTVAKNLPVAVEISLAVANPNVDRAEAAMLDIATLAGEQGYRVYRLLVHLPAAKTLEQQEQEAAAAAAEAGATGTSGTTTSGTTTTP